MIIDLLRPWVVALLPFTVRLLVDDKMPGLSLCYHFYPVCLSVLILKPYECALFARLKEYWLYLPVVATRTVLNLGCAET